MERRMFIAISGSVLLAGCSEVEEVVQSTGNKSLGETESFGAIDVTVTNSSTTNQFTLNNDEITAPSNGIFALFRVEAHNTDITEREVPHVSENHYETLEKEEGIIYMGDVNDIRVYGDGEGGYFPDVNWGQVYGMEEQEDGTLIIDSRMKLTIEGEKFATYPVGRTRPKIGPNMILSGWVIGVIEKGATPQVRISYNNNSSMWTTDN